MTESQAAHEPGCRIVLVGMMGSGKSTIGRLLAERTGWPLHDNDDLLRGLYGLTPKQILEQRGEPALRAAENAALGAGLARPEPSIVDAAGGTILSVASRELLASVPVVWLRARPETLYRRALGAAHRPWLDRGGERWFRDELVVRDPLYAAVADVIVDTDSAPPEETADAIVSRLPDLCRDRSLVASPPG